ncbi:hypothetical protein [Rubritalea marina]|uniref:hypothetical protein n=1 Tax=Rubritalea marina TaxID=361055 RepID=UPI00037C960F|nr:hypothetical protein [Rubritalea marina]
MNSRKLLLGIPTLLAGILLVSCQDENPPIEITERRDLTSYDTEGNLKVAMPSEWRRVPSTRFRDYNCRFNEDGEVYISIASGGIKENAERWLKQFGSSDAVVVEELAGIESMGATGRLIEAQGTFQGMRGITIEDAALLGMMVESAGNLITVKMVAKADEVAAQRENFMAFCRSIEWRK